MVQTNIIVPLYNEEERAAPFLTELIAFCKSSADDIIVTLVNDGSTDHTLQLLESFKEHHNFINLVNYPNNKGKGYAVKHAMLENRSEYVLFIDCDGSLSPKEIPGMLRKLETYDVVAGSRALKESEVIQPLYRKFVGVTFNLLVNMIFRLGIHDNLCGLKGFRREAATTLFRKLRTNGWIFDVELYYRIRKEGFSLYQMPIFWQHKIGTKFKLYDPLLMFLNLISLRLKLLFEKG